MHCDSGITVVLSKWLAGGGGLNYVGALQGALMVLGSLRHECSGGIKPCNLQQECGDCQQAIGAHMWPIAKRSDAQALPLC
jgi:hypothetical protein